MRLCLIANAEIVHTVRWASHFAQSYEVHVISHAPATIPGVKLHILPFSLRNFPIYAPRVKRLVRKIAPDIVHSHQLTTCGLYGGVSAMRIPFIASAWGSDVLIAPHQSTVLRRIVQWVMQRASWLTSDAMALTDAMIALGADPKKILTFPMGVDEGLLAYGIRALERQPTNRVLSLRRLEPLYNVDLCLRAMSLVMPRHPTARLSVGADGSQLGALKELSTKLQLQSSTQFLGQVPHASVPDVLGSADIFVSVPQSDSTSVTLLEAMACGCVPIVSDLPGNREWVTDGVNGFVVEPDSSAISEAIMRVLDDPSFRVQAIQRNLEIISERALWKSNMGNVERLYDSESNTRGRHG